MKLPINNEFISTSPEQTLAIGEQLADSLEAGDIICLHGDLGAGKTHLVKGLSKGLGISEHKVNSPTFTLIHEYSGRIPLYHFDLYRVKHASELRDIGVDDYLYGSGICVIEWPELIENDLPGNAVHVTIEKIDTSTRKLIIRNSGS